MSQLNVTSRKSLTERISAALEETFVAECFSSPSIATEDRSYALEFEASVDHDDAARRSVKNVMPSRTLASPDILEDYAFRALATSLCGLAEDSFTRTALVQADSLEAKISVASSGRKLFSVSFLGKLNDVNK